MNMNFLASTAQKPPIALRTSFADVTNVRTLYHRLPILAYGSTADLGHRRTRAHRTTAVPLGVSGRLGGPCQNGVPASQISDFVRQRSFFGAYDRLLPVGPGCTPCST